MQGKYDKGLNLVFKFIRKVFPEVDRNLKAWAKAAGESEDGSLAGQALSSIGSKRFHAQGGSIYALYPGVNTKAAIRFIVSLQTISDYLDNLCDRMGVKDETAFRQLHLAMLDAVDPKRPFNDYYKYFPSKNDNGYLKKLVEECRKHVASLPAYEVVLESIKKYIRLYCDLQSYKHLDATVREECLATWAGYYTVAYPEITWWEFSAAAGSTLAVFALFAAAHDPMLDPEQAAAIESAYFPWICGLHILLDYYIDAQEDLQTGDLNFTSYYKNLKQCEDRLLFFFRQSSLKIIALPYPDFHHTVVDGLLALYLSDPKAFSGMNRLSTLNLLEQGSPSSRLYHALCRMLRQTRAI